MTPPFPASSHADGEVTVYGGDCLAVLRAGATLGYDFDLGYEPHRLVPDGSIDAVVTDPPYGLEFMGKDWDRFKDVPSGGAGITATGYTDGAQRLSRPAFTGSPNPPCLTCGGTQRGADGQGVRRCRCEAPAFPNVRRAQSAAYQEWCDQWAAECLRVLKPGGHLLAFGGTRTYHRLACAIEDAGFEIRDNCLDINGHPVHDCHNPDCDPLLGVPGAAWLYGCLTADAEVLTDRGWVLGVEVSVGDLVAQWDSATGAISLAEVERTYRAPWDGPMRVLRNADTDQLLTCNHRVHHRTWDRRQVAGVRTGAWSEWKVADAGDLGTYTRTRLPLAGVHDGPGIGGEDYAALLGWVWTEGGFDLSGSGVRIYQSSVNADRCAEIAALLDRLGPHKRYDYDRTYPRRNGASHNYVASTWFLTGELAERVRRDLPGKRPTYGLLWQMTAAEKRALLRAAMLGDGTGWGTHSEQFYQRHEDDLIWLQTLLALVGRAGKVAMRANRDNGTVYLRRRAETEMHARHLRDHTEHYTGEVWCIGVPTGAFVARRRGKVFITGNSGFPKSLDVSKAIDKVRDDYAERQAVGAWLRKQREARGLPMRVVAAHWPSATGGLTGCVANWEGGFNLPTWDQWLRLKEIIGLPDDMDAEVRRLNGRKGMPGEAWDERPITQAEVRPLVSGDVITFDQRGSTERERRDIPATEAAEKWQGWGTALKPAFEPIVVARKPLAGTVAANVVRYGTGALNIDGCRVPTSDDLGGGGAPPLAFGGDNHRPFHDRRRAGEASADRRYADRGGTDFAATPGPRGGDQRGRWPTNVVLVGPAADALDQQTRTSTSPQIVGRGGTRGATQGASNGGEQGGYNFRGGVSVPGYGDAGKPARFFPTFRYEPKAPADERPSLPTPGAGEGRVTNSGPTKVCRVCGSKTIKPPNPEPACGHGEWERVPTSARSDRVAHPTVKPLDLMRWLVRLVTPPGGLVLDPFLGSGTTAEACLLEGLRCVGMEREPTYLSLIDARLAKPLQSSLFP